MDDENKELLTVKEASRLLKINEKKLYALLNEGKLPGTKVTGKWLFPRNELETFMTGKAHETMKKSFWESVINKKVLLLCGSDDPVMSMAQGVFHAIEPELILFSSIVGSGEGIRLLRDGFCTVAVSHLFDCDREDFNFPVIRKYFDDPDEVVVVNLFYRNVGFVSRNNAVTSVRESASRGLRFINRQKGSGVRALLDRLMKQEGMVQGSLRGYDDEVFTHFDVVRSVASGHADFGIAAESVASGARLTFGFIFEERFDMLVKKSAYFDRHVQAFLEFVRSARFAELVMSLKGYSTRDTGRVMYEKS